MPFANCENAPSKTEGTVCRDFQNHGPSPAHDQKEERLLRTYTACHLADCESRPYIQFGGWAYYEI